MIRRLRHNRRGILPVSVGVSGDNDGGTSNGVRERSDGDAGTDSRSGCDGGADGHAHGYALGHGDA